MNKKKQRKLNLRRVTISNSTAGTLKKIQGGTARRTGNRANEWCEQTYSCTDGEFCGHTDIKYQDLD